MCLLKNTCFRFPARLQNVPKGGDEGQEEPYKQVGAV